MSLLGSIAVSTAGRDKGRTCIIVGVLDERYVLIADGRKRKIEKPKKKKMKHIRTVGKLDGDLAALFRDKSFSNRTAAKIVSSYHNSPQH